MEDLYQFCRVVSPDHKMHLERIISIIPLHYCWSCISLGGLIFLVSIFILLIFDRSLKHIEILLILSVLFAWENMMIIWAHNRISDFKNTLINIIELPEDEIIKHYDSQEAIIFDDKRMIAAGFIVIAAIHILGVDQHGMPFLSFQANLFFNSVYYIDAYIVGAGLYVMIMAALAVHSIGYFPLRVNILLSQNIQSIGVLYSKFTILAASVYVIWGGFHIMTPPGFSSFQMVSWFASFAILLIAYFILPQYSIHHMMMKTKRDKLETFSSRLRVVAEETFRNPTEDNVLHLKDMLRIQRQLDQMNEWPFSFYEILHIATIIVIPLVVLSLEILYDILK